MGGVRYGFNLWSMLGLRPKGFFVFLEFRHPLEATGVQTYSGHMQIHLHTMTLGTCYLGSGTADFEKGTFTFKADNNGVNFQGRIAPTIPSITGTIGIDGLRTPHEITFGPAPE
jgi:hypothetical protein